MNWSKIKTIIIYFLLGMNAFLLVCMAFFTYSENVVPKNVLTASVTLLQNSGFEIQEDVLPGSYVTLPKLNTSFYSPSDLSDIFFKKQLPFRTKDDSLIASENGAELTVSRNTFSYKSKNPAVKASPGKIKRKLKKAGINMSGAVYDESTGFFYRMYKGHNLFNMYIKASLDEDGNISEAVAQWPGSLSPQSGKRFSFTKHIPTLSDYEVRGEITKIECGYELKALGGEKYVFTPSWRVAIDDSFLILEH